MIMACRDETRALAARQDIINNAGVDGDNLVFLHLDLSSFKSARSFASELSKTVSKIDILVNNAGVAFLSERQVSGPLFINSPFILNFHSFSSPRTARRW